MDLENVFVRQDFMKKVVSVNQENPVLPIVIVMELENAYVIKVINIMEITVHAVKKDKFGFLMNINVLLLVASMNI